MSTGLISAATTMNRQQDLLLLEHVGTVLEQLGAQSVFVVADGEAYMASGASARLQSVLGARAVAMFTKVTNPPAESVVLEGVEAMRLARPDVVLAIGGGAALDLGKAINHLAAQAGDPAEFMRRKSGMALPGRPMVAIPTTAGSGSEATHFALVHAEDGGMHLVAHAYLRPGFVVLDSSLSNSNPTPGVAAFGLGALALASESIWNIQANEGSIGYANEALKLLMANLEDEFFGMTDEGRAALLRAANLAGKAADLAPPTFLMAMAGGLAARTGASYGQLAGALLGPLLEYNRQVGTIDCADLRGPHTVQMRFVRIAQLMGVSAPEGIRARLNKMLETLLMPAKLGALGVDAALALDVARAIPKGLYDTNTRRLNPQQVNALISGAI
jgi:alcohol dehydrogenase class IV